MQNVRGSHLLRLHRVSVRAAGLQSILSAGLSLAAPMCPPLQGRPFPPGSRGSPSSPDRGPYRWFHLTSEWSASPQAVVHSFPQPPWNVHPGSAPALAAFSRFPPCPTHTPTGVQGLGGTPGRTRSLQWRGGRVQMLQQGQGSLHG